MNFRNTWVFAFMLGFYETWNWYVSASNGVIATPRWRAAYGYGARFGCWVEEILWRLREDRSVWLGFAKSALILVALTAAATIVLYIGLSIAAEHGGRLM